MQNYKNNSTFIGIRLRPEEMNALRKLADENGRMPLAVIARKYVLDGLKLNDPAQSVPARRAAVEKWTQDNNTPAAGGLQE